MKRRLTYFAAFAVLADALTLGLTWTLGPPLGLALSLAVPGVETLLAPLYSEPARHEIAIDAAGTRLPADLYRSAGPRRVLVLVPRSAARHHRDPDIMRLATALARRNVAVLVPAVPGSLGSDARARDVDDAALAHARTLGLPVGIASVGGSAGHRLVVGYGTLDASLPSVTAPRSTLYERADTGWRVLRLAGALLAS